MSHLSPGVTTGGSINYLSKPIRLLDTRVGATGANQLPNAPCTASSPTTVNVAGVNFNSVQVPLTALGALGNVTVVFGSGPGYIELVPTGAGFTGASNANYNGTQIVANSFNVGLAGGSLDIVVGGASANVLVDLFGYIS